MNVYISVQEPLVEQQCMPIYLILWWHSAFCLLAVCVRRTQSMWSLEGRGSPNPQLELREII